MKNNLFIYKLVKSSNISYTKHIFICYQYIGVNMYSRKPLYLDFRDRFSLNNDNFEVHTWCVQREIRSHLMKIQPERYI